MHKSKRVQRDSSAFSHIGTAALSAAWLMSVAGQALAQVTVPGGTCDCFAGGGETAQPRAELVTYIDSIQSSPGPSTFDQTSIDSWFVHSFTNLPAGIASAQIRIKARPLSASTNDTLDFGWVNPSATGWVDRASLFFGPGNAAGVPVLFPTQNWTLANYPLSGCGGDVVIDLSTVTTSGGVSALSRLQSLRYLDFYVQDDTAIDCLTLTYTTVCPGNVGTKTIVYEAGRQDSYTTPFDTTTPRVALSNFVAGSSRLLKPFDRTDTDFYWFAHTFGNLPASIVGANLEIGVRPEESAANDTINLNLQGSSFAWSGTMSTLAGTWSSGTPTTLNFDLASLPTTSGPVSILSSINSLKGLDVLVQDDTSVDYARLAVTVCPCEAKPRVLRAGKNDGFRHEMNPFRRDGLPSRRPELDGIRSSWNNFDHTAADRGVGHSFFVPFGGVVAAQLDTRLKASRLDATNDTIALDLKPLGAPTTFNWGSAISSLAPSGTWTTGAVKNVSLNFDALTPSDPSLGTNMLGAFGDGWLDVYTQDDTMVDHYTLRVTQCPPLRRFFGLPTLFSGPIAPTDLPGGGFSISVPSVASGAEHPTVVTDTAGVDGVEWNIGPQFREILINNGCLGLVNLYHDRFGNQVVVDDFVAKAISVDGTRYQAALATFQPGTSVEVTIDDQPSWQLPLNSWIDVSGRDIEMIRAVRPSKDDDDRNIRVFDHAVPRTFTTSTGLSATGKRLTIKYVPANSADLVYTSAGLMFDNGVGNPPVELSVLGMRAVVGGLTTQSLGGALLDTSLGGLTVSPQAGPGGVRFSGKRLTGLELELDTGEVALAENDFVQQSFRGSLGSNDDVNLGYSRVRKTGAAMRIESDYSPAGITQHRIVVLSNGREVYNQIVPGTTVVDVASLQLPTGCGKNQVIPDVGPPFACGIWVWPRVSDLPISIGSVTVVGDEVRVLSGNAPGAFNHLTSFDVESSLPEFAITQITQRVVGESEPCPTPVSEGFDAYSEGGLCGQSEWKAWFQGNPPCGLVSSEQAFDGSSSLKLVGNVPNQLGDDVVLEVHASGDRYELDAMTYVPSGATGTGYIVLMNTYPVNFNFSPNIFFNATTNTVGDLLTPNVTVPLIRDQWVPVRVDIDLANDAYAISYNNQQFISGRSWTTLGGGGGQAVLAAIDLYAGEPATGGISTMYVDAVVVREVCGTDSQCNSIDFNSDGLFPDDQDLIDFLSVLAGGPCTNDPNCDSIDFNNDGLFPDDNDLIAFLRVLAGGSCN